MTDLATNTLLVIDFSILKGYAKFERMQTHTGRDFTILARFDEHVIENPFYFKKEKFK